MTSSAPPLLVRKGVVEDVMTGLFGEGNSDTVTTRTPETAMEDEDSAPVVRAYHASAAAERAVLDNDYSRAAQLYTDAAEQFSSAIASVADDPLTVKAWWNDTRDLSQLSNRTELSVHASHYISYYVNLSVNTGLHL